MASRTLAPLAFLSLEDCLSLEVAAEALLTGEASHADSEDDAKTEVQCALDWLLVSEVETSEDATSSLAKLSAEAPQRVCTKTFTQGDIIWKCRTCQVGDDTCVICTSCYQESDHEGHDVSFYISQSFYVRNRVGILPAKRMFKF